MEALYRCEELNFGLKLPNLGIILVTLIAIFGRYLKLKFSGFFQNKKLPPESIGFPLVGETISFMKALKQDKPGEWIQKHVDKYGPVFKTSLMGSEAVVLTGQAANKFMFSGSDNGIAGNQVVTVANIPWKRSTFEVSGHSHKLVRGAILSFLKPESLQRLVGEMDLLVQEQLIQELQDKESVQAEYSQFFTTSLSIPLDEITSTNFGGSGRDPSMNSSRSKALITASTCVLSREQSCYDQALLEDSDSEFWQEK